MLTASLCFENWVDSLWVGLWATSIRWGFSSLAVISEMVLMYGRAILLVCSSVLGWRGVFRVGGVLYLLIKL